MAEKFTFLRPDITLELIGAGKRSDAYKTQEQAIKVVRDVESLYAAKTLVNQLQQQYALFEQYLNPYVLPTNFLIGTTDTSEIAVTIIQPFIEGKPMREAIEIGKQERADFRYIKDFLQKAISMQHETGHIPDMFGRYSTTYNPLHTGNVKVVAYEDILFPTLVDTNFSRHSEKAYGKLHNRFLAHGINRLLNTLSEH